VDEHRTDFQATLWSALAKQGQEVERRCFVGAHGNIGGGYADRRLSDLTLAWMQRRAVAAGLAIDPAEIPAVDAGGLYTRTHPIYFRPMNLAAGSTQAVDATVLGRQAADPAYDPANDGIPRRGPSA